MQLSGKRDKRKDNKVPPSNGIISLFTLTKVVNNEPFNQ
jgi:hypothetical protein